MVTDSYQCKRKPLFMKYNTVNIVTGVWVNVVYQWMDGIVS